MKKKIKSPRVVYTNGLRLTIDPNLKPLPLSESLTRKIEEANEGFSKFKSIDEVLKRHANDSSHK